MFIHYIGLWHLSYMCRRHIHDHQGEVLCPLLNNTCCYVAITNCGYSSYVVNYKKIYARIGILQYPSEFLDVAYWHSYSMNYVPKSVKVSVFTQNTELQNSKVDRCSAQAHAFEFLYCTHTVPPSSLAMFIYPFLIG
jgi:hypothetical protein